MTKAQIDFFHPLIGNWFLEEVGTPTPAQQLAWPKIGSGEHVLVTAPTGSGKTLTAFLWAIDRLAQGVWEGGEIRVLYVSPLRALNNDIKRNLEAPLTAIKKRFAEAGEPLPPIRAMTRSGDTPQAERRKMLRYPPEILITTPESLNIMLTSKGGSRLLGGLKTVILDEIHAVAGTKRGTHLITAVERLTLLSGEFQRIALSATVRPMDRIANWIGGFEVRGRGDAADYRKRAVEIIDGGGKKSYQVEIAYQPPPKLASEPDKKTDSNPIWHLISDKISARIKSEQRALVFANSRRTVERVARLINAGKEHRAVYSHHGSLSREIREVVEERLKSGMLDGIVATNSLELGIDVGAIDEVLLVGTPPSIASTTQRVGRAGHGVGQTSFAKLYPTHPQDIVSASVVIRAMLDGEVEPLTPVTAPLDVLAQVILSMTANEDWNLDDLYDFLRTTAPYHQLSRHLFDLVVEMLGGRYSGTRIPTLKPRLAVDKISNTARARPGTARLIYMAGGTIADRGYFTLRMADSRAVIGELDEEFVWERTVGETITLGVQTWRIVRVSHNDVLVAPYKSKSAQMPFWRADEQSYGFWFGERLGQFLEWANPRLDDTTTMAELEQAHKLDHSAGKELVDYLKQQKAATGCGLPSRRNLVVEHIPATAGQRSRSLTVLHTLWGGRVNRPFALALKDALGVHFQQSIDVTYDDRCIALELPDPMDAGQLLALVKPEKLDRHIRRVLESTGFFGAHFREAAGSSLLLPRSGFGRRTPLWLNRQKAKELLQTVSAFDDFPILLETWRTCMQDEMELETLGNLLGEIEDGLIEISEVTTSSPSPFASQIMWQRTNSLMYEDDTLPGQTSKLHPDLLKEIVFTSRLRPKIPGALARELQDKLQRVAEGYSPRDSAELIEWVKERVLIPKGEWLALLVAIERDHQLDGATILAEIQSRVVSTTIPHSNGVVFVFALQDLPRICALFEEGDPLPLLSPAVDGARACDQTMEDAKKLIGQISKPPGETGDPLAGFLAEWLRFYGPVTTPFIASVTGIPQTRIDEAVDILHDEQLVVVDEITETAPTPEVCNLDNLVRLLRLMRRAARPSFDPLPLAVLPLFLATRQGLGGEGDMDTLQDAMERLFGYGASAELWEQELLPARLDPYRPEWLDALLAQTDLQWVGCDKQKLMFAMGTDLDLFCSAQEEENSSPDLLHQIFPNVPGRFSLLDLHQPGGMGVTELTGHLWDLTWQGAIANDSFAAIRTGIAGKFKPDKKMAKRPAKRSARRMGFSRWKSPRPFPGTWYLLPKAEPIDDPLDMEELNKDRVRVLLDRYGILFREMLAKESPALRWKQLFRTLRIMELSGEVIGGCFFKDIRGLQFISPEALKRLQATLPVDAIYWMNATDPASLCGLGLEDLELPRRIPSNRMVYHGQRLVLVSLRSGKSLDIKVEPDSPHLSDYLEVLKSFLTREANPMRSLTIEEINGQPANTSPYKKAFQQLFETMVDYRSIHLSKRY
ncbi:MAG: DEAD/DEAH box helicase [Proteobacteria bacterium]|nr:DEAD/DEAH box helicase [Pseudomonadota bacterium]